MLTRQFRLVARLVAFSVLTGSLALIAPTGFAAPPDGKGGGKPDGSGGGGGGGKKNSPVAVDDDGAAVAGGSVIIDVLANDSDPNDDPLSIVSVTQGAYGSVVDNGDGTVTYTADGTFGLTFPATDNFSYVVTDGVKKSKDATGAVAVALTTTNSPPTAEAGPNQAIPDSDDAPGESVILTSAGSADPDGTISTYAWTWAGGGSASGANPTVSLPDGATVVTLTVTDNDGATGTDTMTATVTAPPANIAPTAAAGADQTLPDTDGLPGESVTLSGVASTDTDGTIATYAWIWAGGGSASGVNPTVSLPDGATVVTLTVTDNDGATDTDTMTATVTAPPVNVAPTANAGPDQTVADSNGVTGELVALNGTGSTDTDGTVDSYAWTWAGGGSASGASPMVSLPDGLTVITLTVTDDDGAMDTDTVSIDVTPPVLPGFTTVSTWGEAEVRRVLHACCYGGQATDAQIAAWGGMSPTVANTEMLSFEYNNPLLSPPEDAFTANNDSLYNMQVFWAGNGVDNPVRLDRRADYIMSPSDNFSHTNLQNTWWEAVNQRGGNPFLHKIGFYVTNHHYAASLHGVGALIQPYYDEVIGALNAGATFTDIQYLAASSATLSQYYGHRYNRFYRNGDGVGGGTFYGNDDFAREFFQLGMRIDGVADNVPVDGIIYHEDVTIENMAKVLSGMDVDREYGAYESTELDLEYVAPLGFDTHVDAGGRLIRNANSETATTVFYNGENRTYHGLHYNNCLEVLHADICGVNADQKIRAIVDVAADHPEALAGLPIRIIGYLFDDNLTAAKTSTLQGAWAAMADKDLLQFFRDYFSSTTFHASDTYKYTNGFDYLNRIWVNNTLSNADSHAQPRYRNQRGAGVLLGAVIFNPAHSVFGAQTGKNISNSPNAMLLALNRRVTRGYFLYEDYVEANATNGLAADWYRDWATVIPTNGSGEHVVGEVADWLWNRFVGDGGEYLGELERAHIQSLLATGDDLNYRMQQEGHITLAELTNREFADGTRLFYGTPELTDPTHAVFGVDQAHAADVMELNSADPAVQRRENEYIGYAVNFIATLPFMFAYEGK